VKIALGVGATCALAIGGALAALLLVGSVIGVSASAGAVPVAAVADIPAELLPMYRNAANQCGMAWEIVAAVGKVESDHGRSNAPGVHDGANFAGAEGPMQFLPDTWAAYGQDGNSDGSIDVYNIADAIEGAANYLCANGANRDESVRQALWNYNHSNDYVDQVLGIALSYRAKDYVLPVDPAAVGAGGFDKPHHDYPADDIPVPAGTPVVAARGGLVHRIDDGKCGWGVVIDGTDGNTYTYCHFSKVIVADGAQVATGSPLALSGGAAGSEGAGDAKGAHLHFAVTVAGRSVCPQTLLDAWARGEAADPASAPTSGCTS
jgi:hypothetical protein